MVPNSTEENKWVMENVEFAIRRHPRNSASYALDQYRILMGNRIRRIKWYHLRARTATKSARNRVQMPSNSAVYG